MTWQGRELTSYYDGENYELSFGYNADGIRTYKEVYDASMGETLRHEYLLNGSQIIGEAVYYVADDWEPEERYRIVYIYDETGAPIGMKYREPSSAEGVFDCYFFEKNLQGDIIAVYNANGTQLITYDYDAWGKCTTTYVAGYYACGGAVNNPFRYRGYYYDVETGWYYLQSRYYNPEWGRFLNADVFINANGDLTGFNMYAYCSNNPIIFTDNTGYGKVWDWMKDKLNVVGTWFSETFGAAVYVSNSYDAMEIDTFYAGMESGLSSSSVVAGDNSKPITFYAQSASSVWKFWEYKVGVNINIKNGGFNFGFGIGESTTSVSANNTSLEVVSGVMKYGVTVSQDVDFKNHTAGVYTHAYIRPWTIAASVAAVYFTQGAAIPAAIAPALG